MHMSKPMSSALSFINENLAESEIVMRSVAASSVFKESIIAVADVMVEALQGGHKLLFAGNGGSAADAQHIAGEFMSRLNFDRAPLAAIALTVDTSVLTAIGNDYGFDRVFERQVLGLGKEGDVFVGISTSGRSPNILRAVEAARKNKLRTIGFGGEGISPLSKACDLFVSVPSLSTPLIQQIHIVAAHCVCGLVERAMFPR